MSSPTYSSPADDLAPGHAFEAEGQFEQALAVYDRAIATARTAIAQNPADVLPRRALGLAWMNRGNTLQKIVAANAAADRVRAEELTDAVTAYDEAIAALQTLPFETEPAFRNHLGAAWLNRGHALIQIEDVLGAPSFEQAIAHLAQLPLETDPFYRLNLVGAWTNLAHATLAADPQRARAAARSALAVLHSVETTHEPFAAMSLRARRALVMALGTLLARADSAHQPVAALADEGTDAVDDGLSLARAFEARGSSQLRPLAARLFRLGAQLYRAHQPHFLAEFALENLACPAFAADTEFLAAAAESLTGALSDLQRRQLFFGPSPDADRILATARSLRDALAHLSTLHSQLLPRSA